VAASRPHGLLRAHRRGCGHPLRGGRGGGVRAGHRLRRRGAERGAGPRLAGASVILAADLLDSKLAYAKDFGATHTVNAKSENVVDRARELTQGRGVDYAFDAIGGEATTLQIVDAIRPGGTAVIVGMAALNVRAPITPYNMALQEKAIKGTMYGSVRPNTDFPKLVDLYLDGRLKIDELISRTYKLEDINEGFTALRTGQVARGVVVFN
jgi:S-(hydroxymethyl)glutathione dehydrogenase/alcohol dehydrogenase